MKVAIDCRMIKHAGIGTYIRNLLKSMILISPETDFILLGDPENLKEYPVYKVIPYNAPIYSFNELLSNKFSNQEFDLVHIPHFNIPFKKPGKLVVTIHDFIYLKFPESRSWLKGVAANFLMRNALSKSDRIISISENTKKDILEFMPSVKEKIDLVYEAADPDFMVIRDTARFDNLRKKYSLPDKFILFVGSLKKHKNLITLLDAYTRLKKNNSNLGLVITGRFHPEAADLLKSIRLSKALYLNEIPKEDLVILYNMASLMVMPSLYEGFGLPVLEAFASEIPVIASNATSIPEVTGKAALLFEPKNSAELAEKLDRVLTDQGLKSSLIKAGREQNLAFSWEKTATKTLEIYRQIIKN